ncbi:MAG: hypothetical protein KDB07_13185, partial [Planctomycetes bacterium]|nr:hypothetical protein [Planctomycetota bacterium]
MALTHDNSAITSSVPHTGSALLRNITLTGWSADIDNKTQGGKLFWKVTTGDVLELYAEDSRTTRVSYGSISSNAVTLAQDNSSGLSGAAYVDYTSGQESTGVIVLSYADEGDLNKIMQASSGFQDGSSNWVGGGTRFETA